LECLFLLVLIRSLPAQAPATGSIRGTVVRWGTTEPVGQATLELRGVSTGGASPLAITATEDTGEFVFSNVAPGTYRIFAMASGFASAEFGQLRPNGAGRPITITPGQQASARIAMIQGGIISGRITDQNDRVLGCSDFEGRLQHRGLAGANAGVISHDERPWGIPRILASARPVPCKRGARATLDVRKPWDGESRELGYEHSDNVCVFVHEAESFGATRGTGDGEPGVCLNALLR
jgi:hypothetical protein